MLLLGTLVVFCYRSYNSTPVMELSWVSAKIRYTVRSDHGYVALCRPPLAARHPEADRWLTELSNEDLDWATVGKWKSDGTLLLVVASPGSYMARSRSGKVAGGLTAHAPKVGIRFMLEALENPNSFALAHYWLTAETTRATGGVRNVTGRTNTDPMVTNYNGLLAKIRRPDWLTAPATQPGHVTPGPPTDYVTSGFPSERPNAPVGGFFSVYFRATDVHVDRAQLAAIRRHWHDLLDEQVLKVPYFLIVSIFSLPPVLWLIQFWRRRRAVRSGFCASCGYDLRASNDRCPECGKDIPSHTSKK
jgi:hypothetical protein